MTLREIHLAANALQARIAEPLNKKNLNNMMKVYPDHD